MTFLWIGLAFVALFVAFTAWLAVLGLRERRDAKREAGQDDGPSGPFLRSRFDPFVPPRQPHTPWSDAEHREPGSQDPDL